MEMLGLFNSSNSSCWNAYKERAQIASSCGVNFYFLDCSFKNLNLKKGVIPVKLWNGNFMSSLVINIPPVCYNRLSMRKNGSNYIVKFLDRLGVKFINSLDSRILVSDKWKTAKFLKNVSLSHPNTSIFSKNSLKQFIKNYSLVFVKPRIGSGGRGQYIIQSNPLTINGKRVKDLSKLENLNSKYIIQEGIELKRIEGRVFDVRALFYRDNSGKLDLKTWYVRFGNVKSYQSNLSKGGFSCDPKKIFSFDLESHIRSYSGVFDKLNLGELGVDILVGEDIKILELNSKPGLKGLKHLREWDGGKLKFSVGNCDRKRWGDDFNTCLSAPFKYAKHLENLCLNE